MNLFRSDLEKRQAAHAKGSERLTATAAALGEERAKLEVLDEPEEREAQRARIADATRAHEAAKTYAADTHAAVAKAQKVDDDRRAQERRDEQAVAARSAHADLDKRREAFVEAAMRCLETGMAVFPAWIRTNAAKQAAGVAPLTEEYVFAPLALAVVEKYADRASGIVRLFAAPGVYALRFAVDRGLPPRVFAVLESIVDELATGSPLTGDVVHRMLEIHASAPSRGEAEARLEALRKSTTPPPQPRPALQRGPGEFRQLHENEATPLAERVGDEGPHAA